MIEENKKEDSMIPEDEKDLLRIKLARFQNIKNFKEMKSSFLRDLMKSKQQENLIKGCIDQAIKIQRPDVPNPHFECPICQGFIQKPIACSQCTNLFCMDCMN
jgi:hypothetical protein